MKVSISLPEEDVEFLDAYAETHGFDSRSAVVHQAVRSLKASELKAAYADAWRSWADSEEEELWESTAADGLGD